MDWTWVKYFGYGWAVLVCAIILNGLVKLLGGRTWYDYFALIQSKGFLAGTGALHIVEMVFLYVLYPGLFGVMIWALVKFW